MYRIFVSHTVADAPIAKAVRRVINDSFDGDIALHLATEDVFVGERWKESLKQRLIEYDAIISIVTPESVSKPWIYVEWSPFWLEGKDIYVLMTEDVGVQDLFAPMADTQVARIQERNHVVQLFKVLNKVSGAADAGRIVPFEGVNRFLIEVADAIVKKREFAYGIYRQTLATLPSSDIEKRQIAMYFYSRREFDVFLNIVKRMRSDYEKSDIARSIMDDTETDPVTELKLASEIALSIDSMSELRLIAEAFIDRRDLDSPELMALINILGEHNRAELRKIGEELAVRNMDDTDLFFVICETLAADSAAEFRNLGSKLIKLGKVNDESFDTLIQLLFNNDRYVQMRDIANILVKNGKHRIPQYRRIADFLICNRPKEARRVMSELMKNDKNLAREILDEQDPHLAIVKELRQQLDSINGRAS